jgi:hypothetical protein
LTLFLPQRRSLARVGDAKGAVQWKKHQARQQDAQPLCITCLDEQKR